jgi:hypothetical protein
MDTLLLLVIIGLLLMDFRERRERQQRAEAILYQVRLAERRIARLADQAFWTMLEEVRRAWAAGEA